MSNLYDFPARGDNFKTLRQIHPTSEREELRAALNWALMWIELREEIPGAHNLRSDRESWRRSTALVDRLNVESLERQLGPVA